MSRQKSKEQLEEERRKQRVERNKVFNFLTSSNGIESILSFKKALSNESELEDDERIMVKKTLEYTERMGKVYADMREYNQFNINSNSLRKAYQLISSCKNYNQLQIALAKLKYSAKNRSRSGNRLGDVASLWEAVMKHISAEDTLDNKAKIVSLKIFMETLIAYHKVSSDKNSK